MAVAFILEYIKKNFFLPGQVENWIIIMDLENLGVKDIPYKVKTIFINIFNIQI